MTNGNYTLDSFNVPEDVWVGPVRPGETRFTRLDPANDVVHAGVRGRDPNGGEFETLLLPSTPRWCINMPILTLQQDQGKIGCAGAANLVSAYTMTFVCIL